MSNPNWFKSDYKAFYFVSKDKTRPKVNEWEALRKRSQKEVSIRAQLKLEWIIFYHTRGSKNASLTANQFGITRKSVHKWLKRYKETGLSGLEEHSRAPVHVRKRDRSIITSSFKKHRRSNL